MKKHLFRLWLACLALLPSAHAQPDIKASLNGGLDLQGQYFPAELSPEVGQSFGILNAEASGSLKAGRAFLLKARPTLHLDPANKSEEERRWADLPEGYAQLRTALGESATLTTQLGYNTFSWGVTDGFNPVDVVSARRYADPMRSEKLGAFSAVAKLDFGALLFEGIYIPWQRRARLPGEKSRWLPREIEGAAASGDWVIYPPPVPAYVFGTESEIDSALRNNFGARLSSHFLGMDVAGYFFDGASSLPAVNYDLRGHATSVGSTVEFVLDPPIRLRAVYNRVTVTGASAVFPLWELLVRAELAVSNAYRKNWTKVTEKNTEAVLELEHTFTGEKSSLTTIGLFSWADPQEIGASTSNTPVLSRIFDRGMGFGLRWSPADALSSEGFAFFDVKRGGQLYRLEATYKLSDAWKAYGGGELFEGKPTTPIGLYRKNDRAYAGVRVSL